MKFKFMTAAFAVLTASALIACNSDKAQAQKPTASTEIKKEETMNKLTLTTEWDKVFPKSDKVEHSKVTFKNHFGIELAADMFVPKDTSLKVNG